MKRRMLLALAASATTAHAEPPAGGVDRSLPENGVGARHEGLQRPRGPPRRRRSHDVSARGLKMHNEYLADNGAPEPKPDAEADAGSEAATPEAPEADAHSDADAAFDARDPPEAPAMEDAWRRAKSGKSEAAKAAKEDEAEDPFHWNEDSSADENGSGEVGDGSWIHNDEEEVANNGSPMGKSGKSSGKDANSDNGNSGSGKPNDNDTGHSNGEDAGWNHHDEDDAGWGHDVQAKLFKRPKSSKSKAAKSKSWHGARPPPTPAPTPLDTPPGGHPSLAWLGVNGCAPAAPCDICTGDCDADADCQEGLECHHRNMDELIPGCAPGGAGDVPGADYCIHPRNPGPSRAPSMGGTPPTPASGDLIWRGVNGCTPDEPCAACEGDCDADADCGSPDPTIELACFKRADGESERIPGCNAGGEGDIPGADYCYDVGYDATPSGMPTTDDGEVPEAHFIRSQAGSGGSGLAVERSGVGVGGPGNRELQQGWSGTGTVWCISGALAPAHSPLLLEPCTPDALTSSNNSSDSNDADNGAIVARMEQMDQLWHMDPYGHVRSVWDDENCLLVPLDSVDGRDIQAPVQVGPCGADDALTEFYREDNESRGPDVLKLQGYDDLCVTFQGGNEAWKGAPLVVTPCGDEDRYGWDFVAEADLDLVPTPVPVGEGWPRLRYRGRNACAPEAPCDVCAGDCDADADCVGGLACFQRERDDSSPVPGCAAGGPGDVAGADYCFDPDGVGDAPGATAAPTLASPLRWLGAGGCTPDAPCAACAGDCDADGDCRGALACFRRPVGRSTPVPGCAAGGAGDVPGGDYCHDPEVAKAPPAPAVPKQSTLQDEDLNSEVLDLSMSMSMPESDESEPPAMKPTEEQTTPQPSHGDSGEPSPSPVAALAPRPAKVGGKSSKGSKGSKGAKWSSSPRASSGPPDGWSGTFEVERERAHRVREGTTRTERKHVEEEAAVEGENGRTRQRGSTRWEREHDAEE